jgi:DNA recombination protein RmuC
MENSWALIFILLTLAAGLIAGWLIRARIAAPVQVERDTLAARIPTLEDMRNAALRDLAVAQERASRADDLAERLEQTDGALDVAEQSLAALRADHAARTEGFASQIKSLQEAREQLSAQFAEVAGVMLTQAQKALEERADRSLAQAQERNQTSIKALLAPVETTLRRYEEGLGKVEKERVDSYAALREAVELVRAGQSQVRDETRSLVNALRSSPKARGRWGEQQLKNVLEMAGLSEHVDFEAEVSVNTEDERRLRPDVIVRLPGGRELIIDAKCSLNGYLAASEAVDEDERTGHLRAHAAAIRTHAQQLGAKDYWQRFGAAADYVVMFIPGEHFLSAALEQDHGLWEWAMEKRVLLATPTNLVAIARTVAAVWRQEKQAEQAKTIAALGKELFERLTVAASHLRSLGQGLNGAVNHYNKFVASFENRVLVTGRKFRELSIETGGKEIEEPLPIETLARLPEPLALEDGAEEAERLAG